MNKILFPFEPKNPIYKEAFIWAVKFARNLDADLIMLNAFKIDNYNDDITSESYQQSVKTKWLKAYDEVNYLNEYFLNKHANLESDLRIKFDHRFIHGNLQKEIRNILKKEQIDLIVLPVSGNQEENKKLLDIISDEVFENNRASLLIVPLNRPYEDIVDMVFATDLKKLNLTELYLNDVNKYANIFGAKIHFLHISSSKEAVLPQDINAYRLIMEIIQRNKKHVFKNVYGEKIGLTLNEYCLTNKINLLAVVKHHHYFLDNLFVKNISDEITLKSKIPVLVMREKKI